MGQHYIHHGALRTMNKRLRRFFCTGLAGGGFNRKDVVHAGAGNGANGVNGGPAIHRVFAFAVEVLGRAYQDEFRAAVPGDGRR